ncbi:MAG TPA: serine/threonine-protein kinase [Nonomuraea sp.]|nr:serine/threonine-protein kinase [Nonomuraea sp.]
MPEIRPLRSGDPEQVAGCRLVGVLGSGGQGTVYKAVAPDGRDVAVKLLHSHMSGDPGVSKGFVREVEAARRVAAFCTAAVLDVGMLGDQPYIVSEYVPGDTLQQVVRGSGPRTGGALDRLAISTLTALAAIHQAGIVHRDFKPANVLVGPDGPIVIDFGIAKALDATTMASGPVGTPTYMSPEQFEGQRIGPASDVFSWAGTMVFAATGRLPFAGETVPAIMAAILTGSPDLSGVPAHLLEPIRECFAKDPAARPLPADLMRRLMRHPDAPAVPSHPLPPPPPSAPARPWGAVGRPFGGGSSAVGGGPPAGAVPRPQEVPHRQEGSAGHRGPAGHGGSSVQGDPYRPVDGGTAPGDERRVSRRALISAGAAALATAAVSAFVVFRPEGGSPRPQGDPASPVGQNVASASSGATSPATQPTPPPSPTPSPSSTPAAEPFGTQVGVAVTVPDGSGSPVVMAADGSAVACGTANGTVLTWPLGTDAAARLGDGGGGTASVAYGELDGVPVVASGHSDGRMRLWGASGESLASHRAGDPIVAVTVAGGRAVAVSQKYDGMTDLRGTVRLWDISTGKQIGATSTEHFQGIRGLAFGRLGKDDVLVTGDGGQRVRVRRLSTGVVTHSFDTGDIGGIELMACTEIGGRPVLVSTHLDATLRVHDLATGKRRKRWTFSDRSPDDRGVAALAAGRLGEVPIAVVAHAPAGGEVIVRVWNLSDGETIGEFGAGEGGQLRTLTLAELHGRPVIAATSEDGRLRVLSLGPA